MTIDAIDARILAELQRDGRLSQRELADAVGLSQTACWRRLRQLTDEGVIAGYSARVDAEKLGLGLTVFMLVQTRQHSKTWSAEFRRTLESIDGVVDCHRIGGEWDYLIKLVTDGMGGYDRIYQALTERLELERVTGLFAMERMVSDRPLSPP